jgi:hypothetical protein
MKKNIAQGFVGRCLAGALALSAPIASEARTYTFEEVASNPIPFDGKNVEVEGVIQRLRYESMKSGSAYYTFELRETEGRRIVSVTYYVRARGKKIADFDSKENDVIRLAGKFSRKSMRKVTGYLGNLYVNKDLYDQVSKEELRKKRR